nr:hypothetical protein B0A51_05395 [Rachicladosporium sp. CCFEE 5018]
MAVSQIEEKILGQLARLSEPSNPLLSASLYQVLGLSILLSRKLFRARKVRKLDITRDTKSLQLYHHIIWLAREGLSIVEVYILPFCQNGESGSECRVMAAKLRASFYHIFCTFHNNPPINAVKSGSSGSDNSPESDRSKKSTTSQRQRGSKGSPQDRKESGRPRKTSKSGNAFRDAIPSITSETSYVTNPYASPMSPPPAGALPAVPTEFRKTPTHPPGLAPITLSSPQAAASFLLPPLNFVPMARGYFETAHDLATTLLPAAQALRLSISLENAVFLWDCEKSPDASRRLARHSIKAVYASAEGLDDEEFADASALVQALGGIVRRGSADSTPRAPSNPTMPPAVPRKPVPSSIPRPSPGPIDRTIALSPPQSQTSTAGSSSNKRPRAALSQPLSLPRGTPDRLSTVPEDPSQEASERDTTAPTTLSPPVSRLSSRSRTGASKIGRASSSGSEGKAAKRRLVEAAELEVERRSAAGGSQRSGSRGSRVPTPSEGYVRTVAPGDGDGGGGTSKPDGAPSSTSPNRSRASTVPSTSRNKAAALTPLITTAKLPAESTQTVKLEDPVRQAERDRRIAVIKALEILASSSSQRFTEAQRGMRARHE